MKKDPFQMGIRAALSPLPMAFVWILCSWFLFFGVCIGLLGYTAVPYWVDMLILIPFLISPVQCVVSMIYGIVHRKEKRAWLGILLSGVGLAENALLFYGVYCAGSRF